MVGFKGVQVFQSSKNIGTAARQRMLKLVKTPYILSLDDDVWLILPKWATAASYIMDHLSSIGTMAIGGCTPTDTSNFGITHTKLEKPFLRFRTIVRTEESPRVETPHPGTEIYDINGYQVQLHLDENNPPYPVSGLCTIYRTEMARRAVWKSGSGLMTDMEEHWGRYMVSCGLRTGILLRYGFMHQSPSPLWHLGRYEVYWKKRCEQAPVIYNRSSEEQWSWYERALKASGWGQPLQNADEL